MILSPQKIAQVLALDQIPQSFAELDAMISSGLPKGSLKASIDHVYSSTEDRNALLYRIIPEASYKRRRDRLTAEGACSPGQHGLADAGVDLLT